MKKKQVHPVATLFPMMDDVSFLALKEDIKEHGIKEFGTLYRGQVLDGRNRYKACQELGIEMDFCEIEDKEDFDPIAYVLSHNLHRRHLTTGQRADVAAKVATMRHGGDRKSEETKGSKDTLISEAASQMKISPASVKRAKKVHAKGSEAVKQAMADGTLPVTTAAALVDAVPDKGQQTKLMEDGVDTVRDAIKTIAKDDDLIFRDVDDDDDAPVIAPSLPVKQKPASKPKKSGCKNCERLSEELKQVRERLNRAMKTCSEQVTVMSDQATLISDLVDSKEQVSTVAKPSKQKPAGWLSAQEVVVSH
jgi:ParB-like chromosome segregation protein Spo0J